VKRLIWTLTLILAGSLSASAGQDYVLTAAKWGAAQDEAVASAGGVVTYSHRGAGIGIVTSEAPDFLARASASKAFSSVAADMVVQWQLPTAFARFDEADITPGDEPRFGQQWNMLAMNAPSAWEAGCTGAGVRVAVLDGGIASDHEDLAPNLDVGASTSFVAGQLFNTDTGGFWHGTHVAGIIAAPDNGLGTIGVAPEATIVGVKVLHGGSGSFGAVIAGILYAATDGGADIINMSLGAVFPKHDGGGPLVAALNKAVNFAAGQGVLVVSAAGNNAFNFDHSWDFVSVPAESGSGIAISATGPAGRFYGATDYTRPASYSNYGHSIVEVAAPGGDFSLFPDPNYYFDMVLSPGGPGSTYWWAAGTSMASPAAAGVAALIKQRFPKASVGALKNMLANSADDEGKQGHDEFYGRGFVNAYEACTQ